MCINCGDKERYEVYFAQSELDEGLGYSEAKYQERSSGDEYEYEHWKSAHYDKIRNAVKHDYDDAPLAPAIDRHTKRIATMLKKKNASYGNSATNPIAIFGDGDALKALYARADDKLNRVKNGHGYPNDDDIDDLIGYLFLIKIKKEELDD